MSLLTKATSYMHQSARFVSVATIRRHFSSVAAVASSSSSFAAPASALPHPRNCGCSASSFSLTSNIAAPIASSSSSSVAAIKPFSLAALIDGSASLSSMLPTIAPSSSSDSLILPEADVDSDDIECAVPKRRTSISRSKHRRAGDRLRNRRRVYQNYRTCFVCGTPVVQHHICPKCHHLPTRN